MAGTVKMWMVNDWKKVLGDHMQNALNASIEVAGRTGVEACKHAIILMAQSARAMCAKSHKNRPVQKNELGKKYVKTYRQNSPPAFVFQWQFAPDVKPPWKLKGTWEQAKKIKNAGLAKKSWMWGLRDINAPVASDGRPMPGVASTKVLLSEKVCGFILTNKLSYIQKAMPPGWLSMVHELAANKILKQAKMKMVNRFVQRFKSLGSTQQTDLAQSFAAGMKA